MENENSVEKLVERMEKSLKKRESDKQEQAKQNNEQQNKIEQDKIKQTKNHGKTKKEKIKIKREKMKNKEIERQERKTPKSFSNINKKEIKYISKEPEVYNMDEDEIESDDNNQYQYNYHIWDNDVRLRVTDIDEKVKLKIIADSKANNYKLIGDDGWCYASKVINGVEDSTYKHGTSERIISMRMEQILKNHEYLQQKLVENLKTINPHAYKEIKKLKIQGYESLKEAMDENLAENEYKLARERTLKNVDVIAYKLLKEYDKKSSQDYAERYLKIATRNLSRKSNETEQEYQKRQIVFNKKSLDKLDIEFIYNTKGIMFQKGATLKEKFRYMKRVANQEKYFGAKVFGKFIRIFRNNKDVKLLESGKKENIQQKDKKILSLSKSKFPKMKFKNFHMPKLNINIDKEKAKKYLGRASLVGIAGALAITGISLFGVNKNNKMQDVNNKENNNIEYTTENNKNDINFKNKYHINIEPNAVVVQQENKEKNDEVAEVTQKTQNTDNSIEQQNPVISKLNNLVNNKWKISSGKYYSSPDGTGNSGNFKNYQEAVKVDLLNLLDEQGNKICTISPDELSNLPEDIVNQVKGFQYHVSNENTELGWNTDKQLDELNESDSMHSVQEEKDSDMEMGE